MPAAAAAGTAFRRSRRFILIPPQKIFLIQLERKHSANSKHSRRHDIRDSAKGGDRVTGSHGSAGVQKVEDLEIRLKEESLFETELLCYFDIPDRNNRALKLAKGPKAHRHGALIQDLPVCAGTAEVVGQLPIGTRCRPEKRGYAKTPGKPVSHACSGLPIPGVVNIERIVIRTSLHSREPLNPSMVLGHPERRQGRPPLGVTLGHRNFEGVISVGPAGGRVQELIGGCSAPSLIRIDGDRLRYAVERIRKGG